MRKIMTLRASSGCENKDILKRRLTPILVTALLLIFSIICVAAAEIADASDDSKASVLSLQAQNKIAEQSNVRSERATVTVMHGGYEYATCNSPIMTVGELLERIGIEIGEDNFVSCSLEDEISDGLTVVVGVQTTEYYTEEAEIPFETIYRNSQTIPKGETSLIEEGKNGMKLITHEVTLIDGVVVSDEVVSEGLASESVSAVYYKGTGGTVTAEDGTVYNYSYYIDVVATAYHTGGITATGHEANEEVVAVDPKVIPYGTKMFITGNWGEIGYRSAEDCGNFRGKHIDICMEGTREELLQFGRRSMRVYILE
ncbi:MAG: G5 domain-containing protein [Clostridia bacterium]|nr:G5 domain-containing protein [Clostridia bacterium]